MNSLIIDDLAKTEILRGLHVYRIESAQDFAVFEERIRSAISPQLKLQVGDAKVIDEDNFEEVFQYWNETFGDAVRNGFKTSRYYVCDIQEGRTFIDRAQSKVVFDLGNNNARVKKLLLTDYDFFWTIYEKVRDVEIVRGILAKIDRLTDETMRRFYGEFFTPLPFAKKGLEYIEKTVGKHWWKSGEYRLWDMAAGTGNLQYGLPADALKYCYLSTLYKEDVEHCQRLFPGANVFQYDYLNDDIGNVFADGELPLGLTWKLPEALRADLNNKKTKWIILINPPFATSQTAGAKGKSKKDVSDTLLRKKMHADNLGETSRELFAQFLFRIRKEFKGKTAWLGLFSKLKYLNANNDQKLRDKIFQYDFARGFIFSSVNFSGTSRTSQFPVGFLVWNLAKTVRLEAQNIIVDAFNTSAEKIGKKKIPTNHRDEFLSKWIERPAGVKKFPPFSSGITVSFGGKDVRDRISESFWGALMCCGNDPQHQKFTTLLSGPYVSAGSHSITPDIFEKSMVVHAVRLLPKVTWLNDRDQFMQPNSKLSIGFIRDCVVWSLFSGSNQTVALRDVVYLGQTFQIHNHFFPLLRASIRRWKITDSDIELDLMAAKEDRFVARWLDDQKLSREAQAVLDAGKSIFRFFYENLPQLDTTKFKVATWDAGWWQVRSALADRNLGEDLFKPLREAHTVLKAKLLPQVSAYGFFSCTE